MPKRPRTNSTKFAHYRNENSSPEPNGFNRSKHQFSKCKDRVSNTQVVKHTYVAGSLSSKRKNSPIKAEDRQVHPKAGDGTPLMLKRLRSVRQNHLSECHKNQRPELGSTQISENIEMIFLILFTNGTFPQKLAFGNYQKNVWNHKLIKQRNR